MKNELVFIVQECICIDFLINAIINSNIYTNIKFFEEIKKENLKNIKIICHIYKYIYKNDLLIKNKPSIKLDKNFDNNLNLLIEYILNLLTKIDLAKKQYNNFYCNNLFQILYNNYFDLLSYIHYFKPLSSNNLYLENTKSNTSNLSNNRDLPIFFNILNSSLQFNQYKDKFELVRNISIEAIELFFDYKFIEDLIIEEYHEVFFESIPENKFYQFFFKFYDKSFKVRIYDKSLIVFYLYQVTINTSNIPNPLNKIDSKLAVDEYLENKFKYEFNNLSYDENYINTNYYKDNIESYKFKYNYINRNIEKNLYISINVNSNIIEEIHLI